MDKKLNLKASFPTKGLKGLTAGAEKDEGREKLTYYIKAAALPASAFLISFIVSGVSPALGVYPFGTALLCAVSSLHLAAAVLLGCIAGSFTMGAFTAANMIISVSVFALRFALGALGIVKTVKVPVSSGASQSIRDSPVRVKADVQSAFSTEVSVRVWCSLGAAVAAGVYSILSGTNLWYDVFGLAFGCISAPVLTFAFSSFSDKNVRPSVRKAGVGALCYAVVFAVSSFTIGGMNISVVLAFVASLFIAYACGAEDAALFGMFMGIALEPSFCAMYSIGAVCAAVLFPLSAGGAIFASASLSLSWALYADGISAISNVLPEIMLASLIIYPAVQFKVLPEKISFFTACGKAAESHDEAYLPVEKSRSTKERIEGICSSLSYMSNVFQNLSKRLRVPGNAETYSICEEAFGEACSLCAKRTLCHQREGFGSGEVIRNFARQLKENGNLNAMFVPDSMLRGCPSIDTIIANANREYNKLFEQNMKCDKTGVSAQDYDSLAALMRESISDSDMEYERNEKLTAALEKKFAEESITYEALSVYGRERLQIFVRGVTVKDLSYGARDLQKIAEDAVGVGLCEPEMSIDYDKLNMYFACRKKYRVTHSAFSLAASECEVNGDVITSFSPSEGNFHMLLCDGMGSGREAALTARISAVFLERMLRGGASAESSLVLLNNFTRERRIECFSTVDLFGVDLFSGKARFIKSGAAPSFVLRDGQLFRLECETMPLGILKELSAKAVDFELKTGDFIIMFSDGVMQEEENSAWFYDLLGAGRFGGMSLSDIAKQIVTSARAHRERLDDTTVGIVKIEEAA